MNKCRIKLWTFVSYIKNGMKKVVGEWVLMFREVMGRWEEKGIVGESKIKGVGRVLV